jgi:HlyD family secretion protein
MAKQGAQKEDKASAQAMVGAATAGVSEVEAILEDQYLTAPCDGQIDVIFPNEGELVALGAPIMNVLKTDDKWVTFNVREEFLADMTIGKEITIMIPALGQKEIKAKIYYVRDLGSYATWHATKTTGDWDSKTFEVKARPTEQLTDLRPGMTVIYKE